MDFEALSKKGKISLLTIPRKDLEASARASSKNTGASASSASRNDDDDDNNNNDNAQLMLLKLPLGWSVSDLKDSHFVASGSKQASLVVEPKHKSFALHKAETSNVLVMVPPPLSADGSECQVTKKRKVTKDGKTLIPTPSRLLSQGGSGASFLELREKVLSNQELVTAMSSHTFDPYSSTTGVTGRTIESLSNDLQVSLYETEQGLKRIQAFPLPRTDPVAYALLAEEAKLECFNAILAALTEVDEHQNYADTGVVADGVVADALDRMSDEEKFEDADMVLRFCLETLATAPRSGKNGDSRTRLQLDLGKVAVCGARRIFQKQSTPWEEVLFMSRWQSELPGIGDSYQVNRKMLRGVAVDIIKESEIFWKYLPVESLDLDPAAGFHTLFAAKDKWQLDDLNPYLYRWGDESSHSNLLLRYTKVVMEEQDGLSVKVYTKS